jgi:hypothetical protein
LHFASAAIRSVRAPEKPWALNSRVAAFNIAARVRSASRLRGVAFGATVVGAIAVVMADLQECRKHR